VSIQKSAATGLADLQAGDSPRQLSSLLTVREVAELLGCSRQAVYLWCELGVLSHVKLGRLVRLRPEDVRSFIDRGHRDVRST
jgi:excisionase family DNA binding protein